MVSMYVSVIGLSMVPASPGLVALTVPTLPASYQPIPSVLLTGVNKGRAMYDYLYQDI